MNLIERVKNILTTPKTEWEKIDTENSTLSTVLTSYLLPLLVVSAICAFIGYAFIGMSMSIIQMKGMTVGIYMGAMVLIQGVIGFFIATYVVDLLAPSFGSEKNINKSAELVAYGYTASIVASFLTIIPMLGILGIVGGIYSLYLLYIGLGPMKNTPEDKKVSYFVVILLVVIVASIIVSTILSRILAPLFGVGLGASGFGL